MPSETNSTQGLEPSSKHGENQEHTESPIVESDAQASTDGLSLPYECITLEPEENHTATVIWLHGLGDTSKGMLDVAKYLREQGGLEHVKFIFPTAHRMVVTGAMQVVMNSWFDCFSFKYETREEDGPGLYRAVKLINDIISTEEQQYNIPSNRIIVGGISQGSAVSILTGITTKRPLGGIFVLAGYIPFRRNTKEIKSSFASTLPIFWGHGRIDPRLKIGFSLETAQTLASDLGIPFYESVKRLKSAHFKKPGSTAGLRFIAYDDLAHWMSNTEMEDLNVWMRALLPKVSVDQTETDVTLLKTSCSIV